MLVTTTTSSTTLTTISACYIATGDIGALNCNKRKKRDLRVEDPRETSELIDPSQSGESCPPRVLRRVSVLLLMLPSKQWLGVRRRLRTASWRPVIPSS